MPKRMQTAKSRSVPQPARKPRTQFIRPAGIHSTVAFGKPILVREKLPGRGGQVSLATVLDFVRNAQSARAQVTRRWVVTLLADIKWLVKPSHSGPKTIEPEDVTEANIDLKADKAPQLKSAN